jgi:UPF0042 nucleotide-binding protein
MKRIIVSGLSGSGKSVALNTLEDLDYYCIDNLPVSLLQKFALDLQQAQPPVARSAVGIDVRNLPAQLANFSDVLKALRANDIHYEILYLSCETDTLLRRYSETRRRHPLARGNLPLVEAIARERALLEPIAAQADLVLDTTGTNVHQLRDLVRARVDARPADSLSLMFQSFGFKRGIPRDADFVFDARCLPNPHWDDRLRALTGRDRPVIDFLEGRSEVDQMLGHIQEFLGRWLPVFEQENRSYLTVAVGCTGGRHRSVYLTERLGSHFITHWPNVMVRHRDLE